MSRDQRDQDPPVGFDSVLQLLMDRFDRVEDQLDRHSSKLDELSERLKGVEVRLQNSIPINKFKLKLAVWTLGLTVSSLALILKVLGVV